MDCGLNGFLHDFADLKELFGYSPKNVDIHFTDGSVIADVHAYSGDIPDSVQRWEPYLDKADLVLLTTHSDDEQLFFAGLLPYYAIERKLDVQVVYFIQHFQIGSKLDHVRPHEQLDGLWTVGIRHYPYISEFPDVYAEDKDRQTALNLMLYRFKGYGYTYDDFLGYTVGIIRRFKPLVLVTHDLNGEYGHGAHVLNADTLYSTWSVRCTTTFCAARVYRDGSILRTSCADMADAERTGSVMADVIPTPDTWGFKFYNEAIGKSRLCDIWNSMRH